MRYVTHPGPVAAQRSCTVDCNIRHVQTELPAGQALLPTMASLLEANRAKSAVARLHGGSFDPFAYYMPDVSKTPEHAAYYGGPYHPKGTVHLESASMTVGPRDSQPWLHCHGTWFDSSGQRLAGHVLPNDAVISQPITASIWLLDGAAFEVAPSLETGFSLFRPVAVPGFTAETRSSFAMSICPNEDFCTALEKECRARGITRARVHGGVGSLVGTRFDDGREVLPMETEVFIRDGLISTTHEGDLAAMIDVTLVDHRGGINEGRLQRAENAVLITFELLVEPLEYA